MEEVPPIFSDSQLHCVVIREYCLYCLLFGFAEAFLCGLMVFVSIHGQLKEKSIPF